MASKFFWSSVGQLAARHFAKEVTLNGWHGRPRKLSFGEWGALIACDAHDSPAVGDLVRVRTRTGRAWVATIERIDRSALLRDGRRGLVVATRPWHGDIKRIY